MPPSVKPSTAGGPESLIWMIVEKPRESLFLKAFLCGEKQQAPNKRYIVKDCGVGYYEAFFLRKFLRILKCRAGNWRLLFDILNRA